MVPGDVGLWAARDGTHKLEAATQADVHLALLHHDTGGLWKPQTGGKRYLGNTRGTMSLHGMVSHEAKIVTFYI